MSEAIVHYDATFMCRCEYVGKDKWKQELMSGAKPILFNSEMVRAILDGRKTVTRRVVKPQPTEVTTPNMVTYLRWNEKDFLNHSLSKYGPYRPGSILYVRETWTVWNGNYEYKADVDDGYGPFCSECIRDICTGNCNSILKWRPSIHMPRKAARIFLRVTQIEVQQVKDITDDEAIAEGFTSRAEFISYFLKIYPDCTENSWCWTIRFKKIEKPPL